LRRVPARMRRIPAMLKVIVAGSGTTLVPVTTKFAE
jgi:hypothetical protein